MGFIALTSRGSAETNLTFHCKAHTNETDQLRNRNKVHKKFQKQTNKHHIIYIKRNHFHSLQTLAFHTLLCSLLSLSLSPLLFPLFMSPFLLTFPLFPFTQPNLIFIYKLCSLSISIYVHISFFNITN